MKKNIIQSVFVVSCMHIATSSTSTVAMNIILNKDIVVYPVLNADIWTYLFSFLPTDKDKINLAKTCKNLNSLYNSSVAVNTCSINTNSSNSKIVRILYKAVGKNKSPHRDNDINNKCTKIQNNQITGALYIQSERIEHTAAIFKALKENTLITALHFKGTTLTKKTIPLLVEALSKNSIPIKTLSVTKCPISYSDITAALVHLPLLEEFKCDAGGKPYLEILNTKKLTAEEKNRLNSFKDHVFKLKKLSLIGCYINEYNMQWLIDGVTDNSTLEELILQKNTILSIITDNHLQLRTTADTKNTTLRLLDLSEQTYKEYPNEEYKATRQHLTILIDDIYDDQPNATYMGSLATAMYTSNT